MYPAGIYLFKVNNENNRAICKTYSKLKIKTPERHQGRRCGVFIIFILFNLFFLVFSLLTFNK